MDCGWSGRDGSSVRRRQLWECTTGRYRRGVGWYREGGVEGVLCHKMAGRGKPRFLSPDQERELTEEVSSGRFKTAGEIRDWIESEYGVSYKSGSVYGLLERLGCSPKVPRARHEKADVGAQESWKKGASVAPLPERA